MNRKLLYFFLIFILSSSSFSNDSEREYNEIIENLRCLVCQNQSLSESDSNYSGVSNVTLDGNNITLSGNFTNKSIDIWTVSSTDNLTNMAINHTNYSETNIVDTNGEKLIIVVSHPGYIALISGSDSPVNNYNPDGGLFSTEDNDVSVAGSTIIIITILLLMISLPATIQLIQLMRQKPVYREEE